MVDLRKFFLMLMSFFIININVYACGEIKSISVENATVKQINEMAYLVRLNGQTDKTMLNVTSDYDFLDGYGSRVVNTDDDAIVKIDGYKCGFGIYTYTISFEVASNIIAENTDDENIVDKVQEDDKKDNQEAQEESALIGLQSIIIDGYPINFNQKTKKYTIEVPYEVNSLNISTKTSEGYTAMVSEEANNLVVGNNTILITVVNENGGFSFYEITVVKSEAKSDNNFLSALLVIGYSLSFEPNKAEYTLEIPYDVSSLETYAIPGDSKAKVDITGNENLQDSSVITVTVTAENGTIKEYTISIIKKPTLLDMLKEYKIYVIVGLLVLLMIVLVLMSSKKKKGEKEVKPSTIDTPITTAGEIKQLTQPVEKTSVIKQTSGEPTKLNIITPTDVEQVPNVDENKSTTEVFKL